MFTLLVCLGLGAAQTGKVRTPEQPDANDVRGKLVATGALELKEVMDEDISFRMVCSFRSIQTN